MMSAINLLTTSDPVPPASPAGGGAATSAPGTALPAGAQFGDVLSDTVAAANADAGTSQAAATDESAGVTGSAGPYSFGTRNVPRPNQTQNGGAANPDSGILNDSQSAPAESAPSASGGASPAPAPAGQPPFDSQSNADQTVTAAETLPIALLPPSIFIPSGTAGTGDVARTDSTSSGAPRDSDSATTNNSQSTPAAQSAYIDGPVSVPSAKSPASSSPNPGQFPPAANAVPGAPLSQWLANLLNVPAYAAGSSNAQRTSASASDVLPHVPLVIAEGPQATPDGSSPSTSSAIWSSSTADELPADSKPDAGQQPPATVLLPGAAPWQLIAGLLNIQPAPTQPAPVQPVPVPSSPSSRPPAAGQSAPTQPVASPPPAPIAALEPVPPRAPDAPSNADFKPRTPAPIATNVSTTESPPVAASAPDPATPAVSGTPASSVLSLPGPIQVAATVTAATIAPPEIGNSPTSSALPPTRIALAADVVAANAAGGIGPSQGGQEADLTVPPLAPAGDLSTASRFPFTVAGDSAAQPSSPGDPPEGFSADNSQFVSSTATIAAAMSGASAPGGPSNQVQSARPGAAEQNSAQQPATGNPLLGAPPPSLQFLAAIGAGQQAGADHANAAQVVAQVAHALVSYRGGQELQLQLKPSDLGTVRVDVALHDGVLSVRIEAQSPTTQQILADNLSQLKDSLAQQGVSFDRIDVRLAGTETGFGGAGTADPSFARHGDSPPDQGAGFVMTEADDAVRSSSAPRVPVTRISRTSLDVTI